MRKKIMPMCFCLVLFCYISSPLASSMEDGIQVFENGINFTISQFRHFTRTRMTEDDKAKIRVCSMTFISSAIGNNHPTMLPRQRQRSRLSRTKRNEATQRNAEKLQRSQDKNTRSKNRKSMIRKGKCPSILPLFPRASPPPQSCHSVPVLPSSFGTAGNPVEEKCPSWVGL